MLHLPCPLGSWHETAQHIVIDFVCCHGGALSGRTAQSSQIPCSWVPDQSLLTQQPAAQRPALGSPLPTFLWGLLSVPSHHAMASAFQAGPWEGGIHICHPRHTQTLRSQDYLYWIQKAHRTEISTTSGREGGLGWGGGGPTLRSWALRPYRKLSYSEAGWARPALPCWPCSESPAGEGQLQPSRKPSLTWKGWVEVGEALKPSWQAWRNWE